MSNYDDAFGFVVASSPEQSIEDLDLQEALLSEAVMHMLNGDCDD